LTPITIIINDTSKTKNGKCNSGKELSIEIISPQKFGEEISN